MVWRPTKGISLRETASIVFFCIKICALVSALSFLQNPKKYPYHFVRRSVKLRMRRTETPEPISTKFCTVVDIPDIVTNANFGDHQLSGFWVVGSQIFLFAVDFHRRPYNNYCKKLNSLKHLVRTTVAELHN